MKYNILIEEVVSKQFSVEAASEREALNAAIQNYKNGEFVLDPGEVEQRRIAVSGDCGETNKWVEF